MRRKALSSPEDSARLLMLAYCLKAHCVRFVVCLDALKSTQAWPARFSGRSISISVLHFDFSCATLFDRTSKVEGRSTMDCKIRSTYRTHCARGSPGCRKCQEAKDEGKVIEFIETDSNEEQATRLIEQFRSTPESDPYWSEFRVVRTFKTAEEAWDFARENKIWNVDVEKKLV
jgi:hypothetical protein